MSLPQGNPQRAVWLYNDSIMCVIIQNGTNSLIAFLNWYLILHIIEQYLFHLINLMV